MSDEEFTSELRRLLDSELCVEIAPETAKKAVRGGTRDHSEIVASLGYVSDYEIGETIRFYKLSDDICIARGNFDSIAYEIPSLELSAVIYTLVAQGSFVITQIEDEYRPDFEDLTGDGI